MIPKESFLKVWRDLFNFQNQNKFLKHIFKLSWNCKFNNQTSFNVIFALRVALCTFDFLETFNISHPTIMNNQRIPLFKFACFMLGQLVPILWACDQQIIDFKYLKVFFCIDLTVDSTNDSKHQSKNELHHIRIFLPRFQFFCYIKSFQGID